MSADLRALQELIERAEQQQLEKPVWNPQAILSPSQFEIFADTAKTVGITAGRRFGKSHVAGVKGIDVCLQTPNITAVYTAATRESARAMVWQPVLDLNREYQLGGIPNEQRLSLKFPSSGSTFRILPVDSQKLADRLRGIRNLYWVAVDETQLFKPDVLDYLIRQVIRFGQLDALAAAQVWLMGTPNPLGKVGAFYERWSNPRTSRHTGTIYDNTKKFPSKAAVEAAIEEILAEEKQTRDSAWYRTELLAEWGIVDGDKRVYKFTEAKNLYQALPDDLAYFAIGVDIGSKAADACMVVGWRDGDPTVYLVEERIQKGQDDVELGNVLAELAAKYDPIVIVCDAGGGGDKTVMTVQHLHPELPIEPAKKPPKAIQANVLNGLLKTGRFKSHPDQTFTKEIVQIGWVDGVVNGAIDDTTIHSDAIPAVIYVAIRIIPFLPTADTRTTEEKQAAAEQAEHDREIARANAEGRRAKNRFSVDTDAIESSEFIDVVDLYE